MKERDCAHCGRLYVPDARNAWHQRYCTRDECQRARNRESCRKWRAKNPDYFKDDTKRSQEWRAEHPKYWRLEMRKILVADILLPVYRGGKRLARVRVRDKDNITLQHVVLPRNAGRQCFLEDVGFTLQNVIANLRCHPYVCRHCKGEKACRKHRKVKSSEIAVIRVKKNQPTRKKAPVASRVSSKRKIGASPCFNT